MADRQRSMVFSLPMIVTLTVGIVLLAVVLWRWQVAGSGIGWGAVVWLVSFLGMCVIRTPHAMRGRANPVVESRKDATEKALLAGAFLTMMVLPLAHLATGVFAFADYALPDGVTAVGTVLQIPFLWLFWRSHADLGLNWSPGLELRETHELVTRGVYARIRHPMYAAIWIQALTQPLLLHNWIAGFLAVPAFAAMWFLRVPQEEELMHARFGNAYDAYAARAGRLFPKVGR